MGVCRELGVNTLSEGVETVEQYNFLKEIGCDMAQGYYFNKPEALDVTIFKYKSMGKVVSCETPEEREHNNKEWLEN